MKRRFSVFPVAGGGTRTRTEVALQRILSPLCLPLPPPRRIVWTALRMRGRDWIVTEMLEVLLSGGRAAAGRGWGGGARFFPLRVCATDCLKPAGCLTLAVRGIHRWI